MKSSKKPTNPLDGDLTRRTLPRERKGTGRVNIKGNIEKKHEQMLGNQKWRLDHLYYIVDKWGSKILFQMNGAQKHLYHNMSYWNIIPKGRQIGFTTFIDILGLDTALFNDNTRVAIVAQKLDKAEEIFNRIVKFAYDNLPEEIKQARGVKTDNKRELKFSNNSVINVDTSVRGGVAQFLHISEFAKICADTPDKAEEIVTGSLPAVHAGNVVFIESTSKGAIGYFPDWCKEARNRQIKGIEPNKRQFKLNFYPWMESNSNRLDPEGIIIYPYMETYFAKLKVEHEIELDDEQKAWYANEWLIYKDKMKQENPSFFDECFWVSSEGAYYLREFHKIREDGRISDVPYMPSYLVDTIWDLGIGAPMVIWFAQTVGRERHYIDYYEDSGEGMEYYANILKDKSDKLGYSYGRHIAPHDIEVRELGEKGQSRWETANRLGITFEVAPNVPVDEGIEASRQLLGVAWFDEKKTFEGYTKLENYKKDWDTKHGMWKNHPCKDITAHSADAFRMDALTWRDSMYRHQVPIKPKKVKVAGWT